MNKKDLNELRKNFSQASDLFTLNHVVSAFVDAEKNIKCVKSDAFHNIPSEESDCYMETLRRILAGTLGKGLLEYEFPNEAYEETGAQNILYNALSCRLADESAVNLMLDQIVKNMDYVSTYAILIGHCTYTVFNKTKNDEINPYDSVEYSFLITAVCPVDVRIDGLIYNEDDNAIEKKKAYDRIVSEVPTDGFLYPTFTGRGPDVNHVLYSVRKPKEVNASIVENVLGCKFICTADQEKESFHSLLEDVVADELSYTVITEVNDKLKSIAEEYKNDADLPSVYDIQMRDILLDSGVSEEKAEKVQNLYREITREKPLSVCNLTENKTTITTEGISVQIAKDATNKVRTQFIEGRRYLLIDLDEPQIQVNGMNVKLQEMPEIFGDNAAAEEETFEEDFSETDNDITEEE